MALLVLYLTNQAAAQRLEYEREMKLRDDRREGYAKMIRVSKRLVATAPHDNADLADALAEIDILTENDSITNAAGELGYTIEHARGVLWNLEQSDTKRPYRTAQYQEAKAGVEQKRASFLQLVRDDLKYEPKRSWWRRYFGF